MTFGSGGARKYGCDQTGCGGVSVVEQPASLIGALNYRTTSRPTSDKASKRSLSRAEPKVRIQTKLLGCIGYLSLAKSKAGASFGSVGLTAWS